MRSDTTPIIPGFYPDPTICRAGGDYLLANSSFEYFPGAPLWHSRDLVTWEQIGNILTTREQFVEGEALPSKGIYGSTLRFHDGTFYFITTNVNVFERGQLIVTTTDPHGPWSSPVYVPAIGIDPDICWDDDGTCLITWKLLDFPNNDTGIRQVPVDPATGDVLGEPYAIWQGSGGAHPEGPHLYKIGEHWYLLLAEGGTERGHMVTVARARRPQGPFEPCPGGPILTRRSTAEPVQSVGHADLIQTPTGEWAMVHLGTRPAGASPGFHVLGRETFLAGVTWEDGWPVVESGRFEVPAVATAFTETFDGPTLHPRWVVPSGDLGGLGREVAAGRHLCVRPRDLRWEATADVGNSGGLEVRMDPGHGMGVRLERGRARAFMRIAGITTEVAVREVAAGAVTLTVAAVEPLGASALFGGEGPDAIALSVNGEEIARLDGRYLSTEAAAGFTGRVIALGDAAVPTRVTRFAYSAAS